MGGKDYRWREAKKRKKGEKKPASLAPLRFPTPEVEVIPKGKGAKETEE